MNFVKGFAGFCGIVLINTSLILATLSFLGYVELKKVIFACIFLMISGIIEVSISEIEDSDYDDKKNKKEDKEGSYVSLNNTGGENAK